ncbi:hypothetical protein SJC03_164 [Bacteroides phage SJC03]|nr:hypothetical protein SJC03_164 [Bacteroides phage SJC03]
MSKLVFGKGEELLKIEIYLSNYLHPCYFFALNLTNFIIYLNKLVLSVIL